LLPGRHSMLSVSGTGTAYDAICVQPARGAAVGLLLLSRHCRHYPEYSQDVSGCSCPSWVAGSKCHKACHGSTSQKVAAGPEGVAQQALLFRFGWQHMPHHGSLAAHAPSWVAGSTCHMSCLVHSGRVAQQKIIWALVQRAHGTAPKKRSSSSSSTAGQHVSGSAVVAWESSTLIINRLWDQFHYGL
jgi:hypothetical protein